MKLEYVTYISITFTSFVNITFLLSGSATFNNSLVASGAENEMLNLKLTITK